MRIMKLVAAIGAALGLMSGPLFAQDAKDLVGTWQLTSNVITVDGKKIDQFGPNPHGVLYFESNGRYALVIVRDGLPKFAGGGRAKGSDEENRAVVQGSIGHFGTYSVADGKIVFHVEHATFPNWDGGTQARPFTLKGDGLSFFVASASMGGGSSQVDWKRIK
ncbi:MAG TPA: lipocalin-like domain-containing protein [Pseudolabrys sp.]|nr:lipocalin-like domain-containing protein [Pseudolabrys sp.]